MRAKGLPKDIIRPRHLLQSRRIDQSDRLQVIVLMILIAQATSDLVKKNIRLYSTAPSPLDRVGVRFRNLIRPAATFSKGEG